MAMHASLRQKVGKRLALAALALALLGVAPARAADIERRLYVAEPGIRNYLEYGGHGLLVFDIDHGHRFVKRIKTAGLDEKEVPINVKGICASAQTRKVYISTIKQLMCLDLVTETLDWEQTYPEGCDRMALSPDGRTLYVPSFEGAIWNVVDARSGAVIAKVTPNSGAHNTIYGADGAEVYLAGLRSPILSIASTKDHTIVRTVGPFSNRIRPFTVNGRQTLCFVNCNELLGFEVGDLKTGQKLHQVVVQGYEKGPVKRHGCPSHGIGMTPDEKEIWVVDAFNQRVHIFDATVMPPKQVESLKVRDEPGWVTFSIDGRLAYPSTGDVIDVKTRQIVATLTDEAGRAVQSEKLLEIDFQGNQPIRAGNQFGIGQVTGSAAAP
jgi:DNA-binding beta-propeller fold protein YncE